MKKVVSFLFIFFLAKSSFSQRKAYIDITQKCLKKTVCIDSIVLKATWCKHSENEILTGSCWKDTVGKIISRQLFYQNGTLSSETKYDCLNTDSCVNFYDYDGGKVETRYLNGFITQKSTFRKGLLIHKEEQDSIKTVETNYYGNGKKCSEFTYVRGKKASSKYWNSKGVRLTPGKDLLPLTVEVFSYVEELPEFPGGYTEFEKYFEKNIMYPEIAKDVGIQGTVYVSFTILKDGSIGGIKVIRWLDRSHCDKEVIRVLERMPKWKPAQFGGRTVEYTLHSAVSFKLN